MEFVDAQIAAQILSVHVSDALKDVAPNEMHSDLIKSRVDSLRRELNMMHPSDATKREYLLMLRLAETQQIIDFQYFLPKYILVSTRSYDQNGIRKQGCRTIRIL